MQGATARTCGMRIEGQIGNDHGGHQQRYQPGDGCRPGVPAEPQPVIAKRHIFTGGELVSDRLDPGRAGIGQHPDQQRHTQGNEADRPGTKGNNAHCHDDGERERGGNKIGQQGGGDVGENLRER